MSKYVTKMSKDSGEQYDVMDKGARQLISEETENREEAVSAEAEAREEAVSAEAEAREEAVSAEAEAREEAVNGLQEELNQHIIDVSLTKIISGNIPIISDSAAEQKVLLTGSTSEAKIITRGVNLWDEVWENGYIDVLTGEDIQYDGRIRSKNYIPVVAGTTLYFFSNISGYGGFDVVYYGANKAYISATEIGSGVEEVVPENVYYLRFYRGSAYGGEYRNDICINISDPSVNGHYYPAEYYEASDPNDAKIFHGYNTIMTSAHDSIAVTYKAVNKRAAAQNLSKFTILSYNIRCLRGGDQEAGYSALTEEQTEQTLENFKSLFQKIKPDVFVVCEDRKYFDAGAFDQTGGTESVYDMLFKHYFPYYYNLDTGANAPHIYSKYPFESYGQIVPDYDSSVPAASQKKPPYVSINVNGNVVYIVGAHPESDASMYEGRRKPYFDAMIGFASDKDYVVMCGDFNTDTATPEEELEDFTDAGLELGNMGYFGKFATYRFGTAVYLDNIVTKGLILNNFTVGSETYSDHFPVSGEINVRL